MDPLPPTFKGLVPAGMPRHRVEELLAQGRQRRREAQAAVKAGNRLYVSDAELSNLPEEPVTKRWVRWGFKEGERPKTFHEFRPEVQGKETQTAKEMLEAARAWAQSRARPFLTLAGPPGIGKTHLAQAAVLESNDRGNHCVYLTAYEFNRRMKDFRRKYDENGDGLITPEEYLDVLTTRPALVIDDIGAGYVDRGWTLAMFEQLFDSRYRLRSRTFVTTNLTADQFREHCGERVWSRLFDSDLGVVVVGEGLKDAR
jgi:DNA replication protein DnaC